MTLKYLHTMVRVKDLEKSMAFYELLGLKEIRRKDSEGGRFSLVFMAAEGDEDCPLELTYNWDGDDALPDDSRHFGHLAYRTPDIYGLCQKLMDNGVTINRSSAFKATAIGNLILPDIWVSICDNASSRATYPTSDMAPQPTERPAKPSDTRLFTTASW